MTKGPVCALGGQCLTQRAIRIEGLHRYAAWPQDSVAQVVCYLYWVNSH